MIIRQLQPQDCFAAKSLWQEIFQDTEPFANFFFSRRFTPVLSFGVFDGDLLVSMALGRRVRTEIPPMEAVMISGVSTLPEYRHQGLMMETMLRLLTNAKARGFDIAMLSPAIPDLYAMFGFQPLTYAIRAVESAGEHPEIIETRDRTKLYPIYFETSKRHPCMLRRSMQEMETVMEEYTRDNGVFLMEKSGQGYLCYLPLEKGIDVTECVASSPEVYRALVETAAGRSPAGIASADLPTDCGMSGTLIRPIHYLPLKQGAELKDQQFDRRSFCIEKY